MISMGFVKTWNQMAALRGLLGILEVRLYYTKSDALFNFCRVLGRILPRVRLAHLLLVYES